MGYRLAPEYPFPAAQDDALAAYRHMLERYPADKIAVVGESAGGGLAFSLLLRLRREGLPMPACTVTFSPWCDLTCTAPSYAENEDEDPSLFEPALRHSASLYSGVLPLEHPEISPMFGSLSGLPDSLIFAGGAELLRDDAIHMRDALRAAGCRCECHIEDSMWHVYVLFGIPEAKQALVRVNTFLSEKLDAAPMR